MRRGMIRGALIGLFLLLPAAGLYAEDQPALRGRLTAQDGHRVLVLWGKPEQAGYAHGYLLAKDIVEGLQTIILGGFAGGMADRYENQVLPGMKQAMIFPPEYRAELEGMLRGIRDRLGAEGLRIAALDRPLTVEDLMVSNCVADWLPLLCSSFSVWGERTADGQTLTARNLDYPMHESAIGKDLIVVYAQEHPDRARWVSLTWPGQIGCYTGMNEFGVTVSMHDVMPLRAPERKDLTPRSLVLRQAIEKARPPHVFDTIADVFRQHRVLYGNNVHVSTPAGMEDPPAMIFEYDGDQENEGGVTCRRPQDDRDYIACTNHYRARRKPLHCERYSAILKGLREAKRSGQVITVERAREILDQASQPITLQSVVFLPAKREMYASFISLEGIATKNPPTRLKLDDLFAQAGKCAVTERP
jgi:hypothetical protein